MNRPLQQIRSGLRRIAVASIASLLLISTMPVPYAFADGVDSTAPSANTCTPVTAAPSGVDQPTGSEAVMFKYNACTGLWESQYYTWNPATHEKTPITPLQYSCNTSTWQWQTVQWVYSAAKTAYAQQTVTVAQLPVGALVSEGSANPCSAPPVVAATQPQQQTESIANGGTGATNTLSSTTTNNATINTDSGVSLINHIGSVALSGSVSVLHNTTGGDATSGDASAIANVLNMLQSSSALGSTAATFVANIDGDVQGDLLIDPSLLQPAANSSETLTTTNNLTVNTAADNAMTNDINLVAASGDATVAGNTTGGNATSGNATAVANVVNMVNAMIGANQSFLGVVNINGNLNGNILVPQNFLDSLIASNAPSATVTIGQNATTNVDVDTATTQAITNNITNAAVSGNAAVTGNTTGGTATTGSAGTHVTIFNLTGNQVIGSNSLLVFVNVLGRWVGVIMNAPTGSTAAALGGSITKNTSTNVAVDTSTNDTITNNIDVKATSGNAAVTHNTTGGNATSGNANTAVNLLNVDNAQFDMSSWFGILFINVFGNWFGSFGAVTPPPASSADAATAGQTPAAATVDRNGNPTVFRFVPSSNDSADTTTDSGGTFANNVELTSNKVQKVLGRSAKLPNKDIPGKISTGTNREAQIVGGILAVVGLSVLAGERFMNARAKNSL